MTPVARPPRSVHPRPYTRCSTVLFLRVLAYAHKHIYTRDAVAYARTFGRECARTYAPILRHNEHTYTRVLIAPRAISMSIVIDRCSGIEEWRAQRKETVFILRIYYILARGSKPLKISPSSNFGVTGTRKM
ncbi:hypothetical protein ACS0PU_010657 [Formica fusca]